jgi:hypothetical protein
MGLRCLTVRVNDRIVRHLISTGYLESRESAAHVACALEAWIYDNVGSHRGLQPVSRNYQRCRCAAPQFAV